MNGYEDLYDTEPGCVTVQVTCPAIGSSIYRASCRGCGNVVEVVRGGRAGATRKWHYSCGHCGIFDTLTSNFYQPSDN